MAASGHVPTLHPPAISNETQNNCEIIALRCATDLQTYLHCEVSHISLTMNRKNKVTGNNIDLLVSMQNIESLSTFVYLQISG